MGIKGADLEDEFLFLDSLWRKANAQNVSS